MTNAPWEYRLEVVHLSRKDDYAASRAEAASNLDVLGRDG
jgi:hypothetical protein